jgi:hypothetical protein
LGDTKFNFDYSLHIVGTEYELNNGALVGDSYCAAGTTWQALNEQTTLPKTYAFYNR